MLSFSLRPHYRKYQLPQQTIFPERIRARRARKNDIYSLFIHFQTNFHLNNVEFLNEQQAIATKREGESILVYPETFSPFTWLLIYGIDNSYIFLKI